MLCKLSYRKIDDTYSEMRCGFSFDPKELVRSIPYKYLVSNPKFRHEQFEFLGTAYRPEYSRSYSFAINRALNISENKLLQASNKGRCLQ